MRKFNRGLIVRLTANRFEQRVFDEIRIGKETVVHTAAQHSQSGRLIAQDSVGLRHLVDRLCFENSTRVNFPLGLPQDGESLGLLARNPVAQRFSDLRLKERRVQFESPVKMLARGIPILLVVLAEPR